MTRGVLGRVGAITLLALAFSSLSSCAGGVGHAPMMGRGMMGGEGTASSSDTIAEAPTVEIAAVDFGFVPSRIEVNAGEPLNLRLTNRGKLFHDLTFEDLDVRLTADPGNTSSGGIADLAVGEYRFECSVSGHAAAGMVGLLVVNG